MMKLSTMKKVMDTINHEWRSPLAEEILKRWGYDVGTVKFFRASVNFLFIFRKNDQRFFLRFNDSCERELETIQSEINLVSYLHEQSTHVAQPVKSLHHNDIEIIETDMGTFYAVVFKALIFELDNHRWQDNKIGILDFDDCANYWYVADIVYALREKENIALEEPYFQSFMKGYCQETEVDTLMLQQLTWFLRLHNMVSFKILVRSLDIPESEDNPDWLKSLRKKLMAYIEDYRAFFEGGME